MKQFGTDEYGNKNGFHIICEKCGKSAWCVPIHHSVHHGDEIILKKITFEFRCSCGNEYGATIHGR